jgi:hypothetical protein
MKKDTTDCVWVYEIIKVHAYAHGEYQATHEGTIATTPLYRPRPSMTISFSA